MTGEQNDEAIRLFFEAIDAWPDYIGCGDLENDWVDDRVGRVVTALLAAGWVPPLSK